MGREIFPPTNDFSEVNRRFERLAKRIALDKGPTYEALQNNNYSLSKTQTTMQTIKLPNQVLPKNPNQLIFVEFEKVAGDGQTGIVLDSYNNTIAYTHRSYNEETQRYENHAYDVNGNLMMTKDKSWEIKKALMDNRDQLLPEAHQRRIESNAKAKQAPEKTAPVNKIEPKNKEVAPVKAEKREATKQISTQGKKSESKAKSDRQIARQSELEELRDSHEESRDDMNIEY